MDTWAVDRLWAVLWAAWLLEQEGRADAGG